MKIELTPPDISPYQTGNTGVDYVHLLDSGKHGPTVMVQALTNGNEYCGAMVLDLLFKEKVSPAKGKLILSFANVAAFARFDFNDPDRSRYIEEDYNRVWGDDPILGPRDSAELRRARQLRPFVDSADYLLDLHSMHEPCRPIMVCGVMGKGGEKSIAFTKKLGMPGDLLVDTGHPAGLRMIERGGFGDPESPKTAVLIECGQHWEKSSFDVAKEVLSRFLSVTGIVSAQVKKPQPQKVVSVTEAVVAKTMQFRFEREYQGLECIPKAGTPVARDGDKVWKTPYDDTVLVMPSIAHLKPGTTMVRLGRYI